MLLAPLLTSAAQQWSLTVSTVGQTGARTVTAAGKIHGGADGDKGPVRDKRP